MTVRRTTTGTKARYKKLARIMPGAVGKEVYVVDEKYSDMATALSSSGPGYVFLFVEALIDAGVHMCLPRDVARELVIPTVSGYTRAVEKTSKHPAALRNVSTSPGGPSREALLDLERGEIPFSPSRGGGGCL